MVGCKLTPEFMRKVHQSGYGKHKKNLEFSSQTKTNVGGENLHIKANKLQTKVHEWVEQFRRKDFKEAERSLREKNIRYPVELPQIAEIAGIIFIILAALAQLIASSKILDVSKVNAILPISN